MRARSGAWGPARSGGGRARPRRVALRHDDRMHHIGFGAAHARTPVALLIAALGIRVLTATTGELLRHLTHDPTR